MTRLFRAYGRIVLTALFVIAAVVALLIVWRHYESDPWTRDGIVSADVVKVTSDDSGLVTQVRVHDNEYVRRGNILFVVDEAKYAAKVQQAQASVTSARASVYSARATLAKDRATLASDERDAKRYLSLGDLESQEERDQKVTKVEQDRAQVAQDLATAGEKIASVKEAEANLRSAQVDLDHATVRAGVDGYITNFSLRPGDYISSSSPQFALVDTDSFYVLGYFEETKLHRFPLGARARINLLGDDRPLWGHVDSMSAGIADRQQDPSTDALPNVTPTFSWIRLASRVPVRVVIDSVPPGLRLVAGRTATVTILPTAQLIPPRNQPETRAAPNNAPVNRASPTPIGRREGIDVP